MGQPDLLLPNGRVHGLTDGSTDDEAKRPDSSAVAVSDGRIVWVGKGVDPDEIAGRDTTVVDLEDQTVLPGFIDAHTHLVHEGMSLVHADLAGAASREEALDRLAEHAADPSFETSWVVGVGYDESTWPTGEGLSRDDLDDIAPHRPAAAVRVDMHTAVLNSVAFERFGDRFESEHVRTMDGEPTGQVVEDALAVIEPVFDPSPGQTRRLIERAIDRAVRLGVTGIHDKVASKNAARIYRDLDRAGDLDIRVRIDYWRDFLDSIVEVGLRSNHGGELVTVGAIKTFTDGSIGARTARVSAPYADEPDSSQGQWVVKPDRFQALVAQAARQGMQIAAHAIGDEAVDNAVDVLADAEGSRHRIEHVELASDDAIGRMAEAGLVASMQPNFHRWAVPGGLYERALGTERTGRTNRFQAMLDAGVPLAFGSDCMPMDPLVGLHHAVNGPSEEQSVSVTEALRAYTIGAAYAGFDEDRLGTIEVGKRADLVVLDRSPWERPDTIADIGVALTIVDGRIVYDGR